MNLQALVCEHTCICGVSHNSITVTSIVGSTIVAKVKNTSVLRAHSGLSTNSQFAPSREFRLAFSAFLKISYYCPQAMGDEALTPLSNLRSILISGENRAPKQ